MAIIPKYLDNSHFNMEEFLLKNYLPTNDCKQMDKLVQELQLDYDDLSKRALEPLTGSFIKDIGISNIGNHQKNINVLRSKISEILATRKNQFALLDCTNKIETVKQDETASAFTTTSVAAETRILTDSKNKQYGLIGIGSLVLLTALYILTKKKAS